MFFPLFTRLGRVLVRIFKSLRESGRNPFLAVARITPFVMFNLERATIFVRPRLIPCFDPRLGIRRAPAFLVGCFLFQNAFVLEVSPLATFLYVINAAVFGYRSRPFRAVATIGSLLLPGLVFAI